jgi:hypothetical protein
VTQDSNPWHEHILAHAASGPRDRISLGLNYQRSAAGFVAEAARRRNLSITAYARRALMAFVCHDLELDWDEVMRDEPGIWTRQTLPPDAGRGQGHGPWRIRKLVAK